MSEQLTPETDAKAFYETPIGTRKLDRQGVKVPTEFARKLERERDSYAAKLVASEAYTAGLLAERDEARELARELRDALEYILGDSVSHLRNTAIERAQAAVTKAKEVLP